MTRRTVTTFHGLFHSVQLNNMEIHPRDKKKNNNNFANPAFISFLTTTVTNYSIIIALNIIL